MSKTLEYNKLGFLAPVLIEVIDNLKGTNQYKQNLKRHLNGVLIELEKVNDYHFGLYQNHSGEGMDGKDLYHLTSKAYDFLFSKQPHEVVTISQIIRQVEEKGIDYKNQNIEFKPIVK